MENYQIAGLVIFLGILVIIFTTPGVFDSIKNFLDQYFKSPYSFEIIDKNATQTNYGNGTCILSIKSSVLNRGPTVKSATLRVDVSNPGGNRTGEGNIFITNFTKLEIREVNANFSVTCDEVGGVIMEVVSYTT